jgi:hypothetical protein
MHDALGVRLCEGACEQRSEARDHGRGHRAVGADPLLDREAGHVFESLHEKAVLGQIDVHGAHEHRVPHGGERVDLCEHLVERVELTGR